MKDQHKVTETLTTGWQFKQTDTKDWLPVRRVPTVVHLDLLDNKKIVDPYLDFNEADVQWVGEKSWTYRVTLPEHTPRHGFVTELVFDGLDTFATVRLNGFVILKSDNMFIPQRVDITNIQKGRDELEIEFDSAWLKAKNLQEEHPDHKYLCWNGDTSRLTTRKAQYHWGWDWGPVLMTAGPWRAVRLETFKSKVADLWVEYGVTLSSNYVYGTIHARVSHNTACEVIFSVKLRDQVLIKGGAVVEKDGVARLPFSISQVNLWYPHGYGEQTLHDVSVLLSLDGSILDSMSKRMGFRHAELVQKNDKAGTSFFFRINGIDVFCGGSNWIPADNFIPRITKDKYREWLKIMVDGNQIMTRVWGGGIWEEDAFYDLCDELGILVWQDFMFACGNYPVWPELLASVKDEAAAQLQRLRHHCSIVVYAGNNEDYQLMESEGLTYDYDDKSPEHWLRTDFPARYIYEKLLPDIVQEYTPYVAYQPGSPWSNGKHTTDKTVGDLHQWNVWHGTQEKYQLLSSMGGRFNSEFGMQGFPFITTIESFCTNSSQLYPQSRTLDFHNKATGFERRIAIYLSENVPLPSTLVPHIYLTQLIQSEALSLAYKGWRKQYGEERHCGGALVWQLNDCWPGTSWSIVDYFQYKKAAYYTIARALAPIAVGVQREHHDWSNSHEPFAKTSRYEVWLASSKLDEVHATVELRCISIASGLDTIPAYRKEIAIIPNGTTHFLSGVVDNVKQEPCVLAARVFIDGVVVARDVDWPQPLKYLSFADRGLEISYFGNKLVVTTKRPVKGLLFGADGKILSDNALDVVPDDKIEVLVTDLRAEDKPLEYKYLGQDP